MAIVALCAVAMVSAPAAAQEDDDDDAPGFSLSEFGLPLPTVRSWSVGASLNSFYDNNFRRTSGSDQVGAFRISPSVRGSAQVPLGQQQLSVSGNYGRDYTIGNPDFNRSRWNIRGGLGWRLGARCSGNLNANTGRRLNLVADQAEFTPNAITQTGLSVSANCRSASGFGLSVNYNRLSQSNDAPDRALFDLQTSQYAANLFYGNEILGQISLGASMADSGYANRFVVTRDGIVEDGVRVVVGQVNYSRGFGSRLQLSTGLSYQTGNPQPKLILLLDPVGQIVEVDRGTFGGLGYNLGLTYTVSDRLTVSANASRNTRATPNVGALGSIQQVFGARANYQLNPSLSFSTGLTRRQATFKESFASPGEPLPRVGDTFMRYFASLAYNPDTFYTVNFQLAHQQRTSNPSLFSFSNTTALLSLNVNFGKG